MAERAHPEDPAFRDRWVLRRYLGNLIPLPVLNRSPWKRGLECRYRFCAPFVRHRDVLDIPCGMGWGTSLIRGARSVTGVDIDATAVAEARERYGHRIRFLVGSMSAIPCASETFDVVLCLEGIEHVDCEVGARFVCEAARTLRPHGRLVVTSPLPDPRRPPNPYHIHEYTADELAALVETRLRLETVTVKRISGVDIGHVVARKTTW